MSWLSRLSPMPGSARGQCRSQLAPGIVDGLVEGSARAPEPFGHNIDRNVVEGGGDQEPGAAPGLVRSWIARRRAGCRSLIAESARVVGAGPGPATALKGGFDESELAGPGREPTLPSKPFEIAEDCGQGRRGGDARELITGLEIGHLRAPATNLEPGRSEEETVQLLRAAK